MFGRRRLKAEIVRLSYRVAELEERLCPCESHSWVVVDSDFTVGSSAGDIDTIYRYKCRRCGKTLKTYKLLPTESYTGNRVGGTFSPVLSHHRAYRSVHGGSIA
jgi:transposase-like protein